MEKKTPIYHFPKEIPLINPPLVEAWLEIQWELTHQEQVNSIVDEAFPFALGVFYANVKKEFGYKESLPSSLIPIEMIPHVVRFRFRKQPEAWPMLQLGPGVASVNFHSPYTWDDFKSQSIYLRQNLIDAYLEKPLKVQKLILRYRNATGFDYISSDFLDFLATKLNISVKLPEYIPGNTALINYPSAFQSSVTYDLNELGKGVVKFGTGTQKFDDKENRVVVFDIEIHSLNDNNTHWVSEKAFEKWLTSAHEVIHEWFFALIDGKLRMKYEGKDE